MIHLHMYIRQTKTGNTLYFTFRLVASRQVEGKVRQQTLLNLGRKMKAIKDLTGFSHPPRILAVSANGTEG